MSVSINTNANAQFAAVAVKRANEMMDEAMLRLSTGKRLNSAKMTLLVFRLLLEWKKSSTVLIKL